MEQYVNSTADAEGEVVELEIQQITEALAKEPLPRSAIAVVGEKAARRVLDSWPLAVALVGSFAFLTFLNVTGDGFVRHGGPQPSAAEQLENVKTLARFAAVEARAFLDRNGRLPSSPEEIGLSPRDDVTFHTSGGSEVTAVAKGWGFEARFQSRGVAPDQGEGR